MKERPILFSAPMIRALLDGSKTQTRRVVKSKALDAIDFMSNSVDEQDGSTEYLGQGWHEGQLRVWSSEYPEEGSEAIQCPYGLPGDRLWVKETTVKVEDHGYVGPVYAESDYGRTVIEYGLSPSPDDMTEVEPEEIKLRPSLFMTKAMSRITLEITGVRLERLQDISEADAIAEGCKNSLHLPGGRFANENYRHIWWTINGDGSWESNPWVWVVEFKVVKP